jgi:hypothetical protein
MGKAEVRRNDRKLGRKLQVVTGWALLIAGMGIFFDSAASRITFPTLLAPIITPAGADNGSIGLIPAYLGLTIGMICFPFVVYKASGIWPGLVTGAGVVGMFIFWYGYPHYSTIGGLGSILIGIAVLWLPGWARFVSPLWVASGIMGITELVRPGVSWGPIAGFTLAGAAVALTGAFVLWVPSSREPVEDSVPLASQTAH